MPRSRNRSGRVDDDGHRRGASEMHDARAPGQLPVWARIRSFHRNRRNASATVWHQSLPSTSSLPELWELSTRSVVMGGDSDPPLSLAPISDTPLDPPNERASSTEPWRNDVDIPRGVDSRNGSSSEGDSDQAVCRESSSSEKTTDYSFPPELRPVPNRKSSSSSSDPPNDYVPQQPSFWYTPPELRPAQVAPSADATRSRGQLTEEGSEFVFNEQDTKSQRRNNILLFLFAILAGVGIGVGVGVSQRNKNESSSNAQGQSQCNYAESDTAIPNAFVQCECDGNVTLWTDEIQSQYYNLRENYIPTILPNFDEDEQSCDPTNTALWQLSNDTLYGAKVTDNRYLLTLLYGNWDGEGWRSKESWLSTEISECQWEGIGCTDDGLVRTISLESNNLGGTMPTEIALLTALSKWRAACYVIVTFRGR